MQGPVYVLNTKTQREEGRKAQKGNISAGKAIGEIIRTCLGPKSMLKMILDPMGGIAMTNDGNAILREIDVNHPAAKSMIELSRSQDENVGDGTTSVIILTGQMLAVSEPFLDNNIHPTVIISAYTRALEDALAQLDKMSFKIDLNNREQMLNIVRSCIGTKFVSRWSTLMCDLALDATLCVRVEEGGRTEVDIKRYAKVEKIPGGEMEDCRVLRGVMLNKDVTHAQMRRRIVKPRILLLDCPLEFKKGESQTNIEVTKEDDWMALLKQEEDYIQRLCADIIKFKPDVVLTEKGLSDLAQHYFVKNNITAFRRVRKTDNNRLARVSGATIANRPEELQESDIGTQCHLFEVRKIGDDYYAFFEECVDPKACTILLRGASKDVLNEVERNLNDAMNVARNVVIDNRLVPGGGAAEMSMAHALLEKSKSIDGVQQGPYKAVGVALEVIPSVLTMNCGANVVRLMTELRAKHASDAVKHSTWGIDGNKGVLCDMKALGIWEPYMVKSQTIKTAVEAASMLLRVDAIVSGLSKPKEASSGQPQQGAADPESDPTMFE